MRRCDVLIVGGGAMGSATAWQLARRGVDVVLLERFGRHHANGSSHGATRIFRFAYSNPLYVQMAQGALPLWRELEQDSGESLLDTTGGLDIGREADIAEIEGALGASGAHSERVDAADASERWPGIAIDGADDVVLFQPDSGRLWAERTVSALQAQATHHGGEVRHHEPVVELSISTGHARTDADEYLAETIVVTAGAWVADVLAGNEEAEGLPQFVVTREQTFHFAPLDDDLAWPSFIHHRDGGAPAVYGLETPGEGIKVAEHGSGAVTDPDGRSFDVDEIGRQRVIRYVTERLPGVEPRPTTELTCLYTSTPDNGFVLERRGRLVVGSACSGHGFKFTPLIGQRLADLATGG
ncbi:MAG TPA: FAD-dependent oxidoreductase [Acidimicrobiales bacterium]|nr:FAD-dependent oxidoreductase [Acidimicrobiales bacterium]